MPATEEQPTLDEVRVRITPSCGRELCSNPSCRRYEDELGPDGYDADGLDRDGYDRDGYHVWTRLNRDGRTVDGYDAYGYSPDGYSRYGYDVDGYDRDGYNQSGYDRSGYDREGFNRTGHTPFGTCRSYANGGCACTDESMSESDYDDDRDYDRPANLHYYSYRPNLRFRGDNGPYYGMEIEITTDRIADAVDTVSRYADDLIYCKEDSSVDGMEMVTHPMSYEWAMANFPWDMLPALRRTNGGDATVVPSDNGIHVHVGRDAFDNAAHLYRWLKLWYRNPRDMQRIARRRAESWGAFRPEHRAAHKYHVKRGKPGYEMMDDGTMSRYSAINTTNNETLEVRIFASSLRPRRVKAALQLVAASVEYTRQLTPDAVCKRHGWDWRAFMAWVRHSGKYPDLVAEDRNREYI